VSWSKRTVSILFLVLLFGLSGCSSSDSKNESAKMSSADKGVMDSVQSGKGEESLTTSNPKKETSIDALKGHTNNQKVIYQAELELRVKNYEQTVQKLEEEAKKYGGYIKNRV
jgi:hypothetical protein